MAIVAKPSVATKKDAAVDDDASAFESETQSLTANSLIMSDKSKDQSDANDFASKTQSLIEDPPALPKLAQKNLTKAVKVAIKPISTKMVSPKKPSTKSNIALKPIKVIAAKKVSPIVAIKPKSAVKKPSSKMGQKSVTDLVAKTIALAKNKKSNVFSEVMNLAIH